MNPSLPNPAYRVALLHGAGYTGGELVRCLNRHPFVSLTVVTSRAFGGKPLWHAHPVLRGQTDLSFSTPEGASLADVDGVFLAAEHGQGARTVQQILSDGFRGFIIDLSADFRLRDPAWYPVWYGFEHPAPELLPMFHYGLPECSAAPDSSCRYVANPGCFATGLALALWPLSRHLQAFRASVTALTGASGSGTRPKSTTHFPTREGNVRAYKPLHHQHLAEVGQLLGPHATIDFIPVSGPWTRGIWGTAHVELPSTIPADEVHNWYHHAYDQAPLVRLWSELPELRFSTRTPFCDLGLVVRDQTLVVGFALDNLLKGASSQAIQNMNRLLGFDETTGLLPTRPTAHHA